MSHELERIVDKRAIVWRLILPSEQKAGRQTDAYGRPYRTTAQTLDFRGYAEPLGESRTGQHDLGHITRGDEMLWVTRNGIEDPGIFRPGMEIIDIAGSRWVIVSVDDFRGKMRPGNDKNDGFIRLQISKKAMQ